MIYWNADLAARLACSPAEMADIPEFINTMLAVAEETRKNGPRQMLDRLGEADRLLLYGMHLLADGLAGEILEEILATLLYVGKEKGQLFLKRCIIAETLLAMAEGAESMELRRRLLPYCGIDVALSRAGEKQVNAH